MSSNTFQRIPQSGASAAGVSTGMRVLKRFFSHKEHTASPPSFTYCRHAASRLCFRCITRDWTTRISLATSWLHVILKCISSFPSAHFVIIRLCQLENTDAASDQTAKLSGRIINNAATVVKTCLWKSESICQRCGFLKLPINCLMAA